MHPAADAFKIIAADVDDEVVVAVIETPANSGTSPFAFLDTAMELVETIEIPDHPWLIGCQFHPEFTSNPRDGHRLFTGFIEAALERTGLQNLVRTPESFWGESAPRQ